MNENNPSLNKRLSNITFIIAHLLLLEQVGIFSKTQFDEQLSKV
jgi:hypothetical protein